MKEIKYITITEFEKENLCIEDPREFFSYDYNTIEYYYDNLLKNLDEKNIKKHYDSLDDIKLKYYDYLIESTKRVKVFKKHPVSIPYDCIVEYIQDWYYNKLTNVESYYGMYISDKAYKLLNELIEEIHKHNKPYEVGEFIGCIDLSDELKKYIKKYGIL